MTQRDAGPQWLDQSFSASGAPGPARCETLAVIEVFFLDTDEYQFQREVRHRIASVVSDAERSVRPLLPKLATTGLNVTVLPGRRVIPETGDTGFTPDKVVVDPKRRSNVASDHKTRRT